MTLERREYLIDHFRVFRHQEGDWQCLCAEFARAAGCRHTREAAGMREAQSAIVRHLRSGASGLRKNNERRR
jgi:hypothetical protein